ncbi:MAG: hypothetical protein LAO22_05430 [Acidobacteriia bacterium]|nr:hypothetical protein [Terriglobia bacterium]
MNNRQRRVRAIELTLTPQQVVMVWLRNALQAGTLEEGARHSPPHRSAVANAVYDAVRNSMKGQPDPLVERAILQARREADSLYLLVVHTNVAVLEGRVQREREYMFLLGCLSAEMNGKATKNRVQTLRLVVLVFLESVIILDAAIAQVEAGRLNGQRVLFRDCSVQLEEQVQMAERLSEHFNFLARSLGSAEINLEDLRKSLQSETDRQISVWISLARVATLSVFGNDEEMDAAMDQHFLLCEAPDPCTT